MSLGLLCPPRGRKEFQWEETAAQYHVCVSQWGIGCGCLNGFFSSIKKVPVGGGLAWELLTGNRPPEGVRARAAPSWWSVEMQTISRGWFS